MMRSTIKMYMRYASNLTISTTRRTGWCRLTHLRSLSTEMKNHHFDTDLHSSSSRNATNAVIASALPTHEPHRTSLLMELTNGVGVLHDVLRFFWKYDVNVTRIESRPSQHGKFDFFVDLEGRVGDTSVDKMLESLKGFGVGKLLILDEKQGM